MPLFIFPNNRGMYPIANTSFETFHNPLSSCPTVSVDGIQIPCCYDLQVAHTLVPHATYIPQYTQKLYTELRKRLCHDRGMSWLRMSCSLSSKGGRAHLSPGENYHDLNISNIRFFGGESEVFFVCMCLLSRFCFL